MTEPTILDRAVQLALQIPAYDDKRPGSGRRWMEHPAVCAQVVACIYSAKCTFKQSCLYIAGRLGGVGYTTLTMLTNGKGSNKATWPELRAELDRLGIDYAAPKKRGRVAAKDVPAPPRASKYVSWRMIGTGDIEVSSLLLAGTPEHSAFVREVLLQLGVARPE